MLSHHFSVRHTLLLSSIRRRVLSARRALLSPPNAQIERFVFVFTYGRSGSTLLMGLLNSIPGYCIRGENNNAVHSLFGFNSRIAEAKRSSLKNSERPGHPWFGLNLIDSAELQRAQRDMVVNAVIRPEAHHRVAGFKEIRFSEKEVPDFAGYIAYIEETFAPCKIVFNHRNLDHVARSGWWKALPEAPERLAVMEERFQTIPASDTIYHFSYDALCADPAYAAGLMEFLGETYDPKTVERVMSVRHSY